MTPIVCCGETLEEKEAGKTEEKVIGQIMSGLANLKSEAVGGLVIAYEPIWAIGTGKTASSVQAQEIHFFIRSLISDKFGTEISNNTSILYGGSCKPTNSKELFSQSDIDGGLIGGASLKSSDFTAIINSF